MPSRQIHREVFFAFNGPGPYPCFGCGEELSFYEEFCIHHIDEDHENNIPENLTVMHAGCHIRLHKTGFIISDETRVRMSVANRGRTNSIEHRAAISKASCNRVWNDETRAKMSASQRGRVISAEHRNRISETLKAKITPEERARLSLIGRKGAEVRWKKEK